MTRIWQSLDSLPRKVRILRLGLKNMFSSRAKRVFRSILRKLNTLREIQIPMLLNNQFNWIIRASFHRREITNSRFSKANLNPRRVEWDQHSILVRYNRRHISLMHIIIKILETWSPSKWILQRAQKTIISKKFGQERASTLADLLVIQVQLNWTLQMKRSRSFRKLSYSKRWSNTNAVLPRWRPSRLSTLPQTVGLDMNLLQTM